MGLQIPLWNKQGLQNGRIEPDEVPENLLDTGRSGSSNYTGSNGKEGVQNSASKSSLVLTSESEHSKTYKLPGYSGINQPRLNPLQRSALFLSFIFHITKVATFEVLVDSLILAAAILVPSHDSSAGKWAILLSAGLLYSIYEFKKLSFWSQRLAQIPIYAIFLLAIIGESAAVIFFWLVLPVCFLLGETFESR